MERKGGGGANERSFSRTLLNLCYLLLVFYNIIGVSIKNVFIHIRRSGYTKAKQEFLRALCLQTASSYAKTWHLLNSSVHKSICVAAEMSDFLPSRDIRQNQVSQLGCSHRCSKRSQTICDGCQPFICEVHKMLTKSCFSQVC